MIYAVIDETTKQLILDTADIVEVVSDYVTLRKQGANYVGLCPFHNDRRPSFHVSPSKNICKCFACGEGGSPVFFLMKMEKLSFYEALRALAKKYNIHIEERPETDEERQKRNQRESLFLVQEFAAKYFQEVLNKSEEGLSIAFPYLRHRNITPLSIEKFGLGYAPQSKNGLHSKADKEGYNMQYFYDSGLCFPPEDNRPAADRFRERIIFPIYTVSGRIVAFGGRALKTGDKTAKYINSPENLVYSKSRELYGLYQSKKAIAQKDCCFLVEGYMDVIAMHQAGIENVVASSGTALTLQQVRLIRRFTKNITLLYDADTAGIKAALRGIDILLEAGMHIKVLLLPEDEDPDSFAKSKSTTEFEEYIAQNEQDFISFKTELFRHEMAENPAQKASIVNDILRSIALIPDSIERSLTTQSVAASLNIKENIISEQIKSFRRAKYTSNGAYNAAREQNAKRAQYPEVPVETDETTELPPLPMPSKNEEEMIKLIIRYGECIIHACENDEILKMPLISYINECLLLYDVERMGEVLQMILTESLKQIAEKETFSPASYFSNYPDQRIADIATSALSDKYTLSKSAWSALGRYDETAPPAEEELAMQAMCLAVGLSIDSINKDIDALNKHLNEIQKDTPGDFDRILDTMKKIKALQQKKTELTKQLSYKNIF